MRYQNIEFNKNALVFFSLNYINWFLRIYHCENCIFQHFFTTFVCVFCLYFLFKTNIMMFEIFVQIFSTMQILMFRIFFKTMNFETFSTMRVLKFQNKFFQFDIFWFIETNDCYCCKLIFSTKWFLKFFQRLIVWNFRTNFFDVMKLCIDAKNAKTKLTNESKFDNLLISNIT